MWNQEELSARLSRNAEAVRSLVEGLSLERARWKPSPEKWSILEVVNHLLDEEKQDFRLRLDLLLHQPDTPWPGIDPERWAVEREYNKKDPADSLEDLLDERRNSIKWVAGLEDVNWDAFREHPSLGKLRAGDLMASWIAHDYLHLRQMTALHFGYLETRVKPYSPRYAGSW